MEHVSEFLRVSVEVTDASAAASAIREAVDQIAERDCSFMERLTANRFKYILSPWTLMLPTADAEMLMKELSRLGHAAKLLPGAEEPVSAEALQRAKARYVAQL